MWEAGLSWEVELEPLLVGILLHIVEGRLAATNTVIQSESTFSYYSQLSLPALPTLHVGRHAFLPFRILTPFLHPGIVIAHNAWVDQTRMTLDLTHHLIPSTLTMAYNQGLTTALAGPIHG